LTFALLLKALRLWRTPDLLTYATTLQQTYLTFLLHSWLSSELVVPKDLLESEEDLIFGIRDGIDARIQKVHTDPHVYQQGLLIWVTYMRRCGHTEGIEAFTVTPEEVFADFMKSDAP
jgi:hypothetical protein